MSKHLVLIVIIMGLAISGCSSKRSPTAQSSSLTPAAAPPPAAPPPAAPATPPPPPSVAPEDVADTWFSRTENNAVNCGRDVLIDAQAIVITQDDSAIELLTSTGNTFSGTVNGDIIEWTGSFEELGGTTTFTALSVTVSGNSASGNAAWTWTDGTDSCNGTMEITASRDWGVAETRENSRIEIADAFEFTDGVAFITGSATSTTDKDYFSFVLAADGNVQAELSHFDLQTSDLDLELLDENLDQVALSDSADGFEKVEAQLQAGVTYYIGMLPISTAGTYNLSIDLN